MHDDPSEWVTAVRRSHDRLTALTSGLDPAAVEQPSYCDGWSIAQVLSHLGSQAEIFGLFVDAALTGGEAPGPEVFNPIWDTWNARTPKAQASESAAANEALVRRVESLDRTQLDSFRLSAFDRELDATGLLRMRLSEHALHTWDVAVALDRSATVPQDAVELLIDGLPQMASRVGRPRERPQTLEVVTTGPDRRFALDLAGVRFEPGAAERADGTLRLAGEQLLRLFYGRLRAGQDDPVLLQPDGPALADLRATFPGF